MKFIKIGATLINLDHVVSIQIKFDDDDSKYPNFIEFCSTNGRFRSNYKKERKIGDDYYRIIRYLESTDETNVLKLEKINN